ncbi:MAG: hypothetical protein HYS86_04245 [Candidatus Chisholmbacteria bacterium]|nr:hypothetical protein [Candidatus Chisholmbacteria bacterium]
MRQLKQKILFCLCDGVAFSEPKEAFFYKSYKMLEWRLRGYKAVSVRGAINELIVSGMVGRMTRGRQAFFNMTTVGKEQLRAFIPSARFGRERWDRSWRMLTLRRGGLRRKELRQLLIVLADLGFGRLERGVYVSPFPTEKELTKLVAKMGVLGELRLLKTQRFLLGDDRTFATQVWELNTIYNKYRELITQALGVLHTVKREKGLTYQVEDAYQKLLFDWFGLLKIDPGLPKALIQSDWPRLEAGKLMAKIAFYLRELEEGGGSKS